MCVRKERHTWIFFLMNRVKLKRQFCQFGGNVVPKVSQGAFTAGLLGLFAQEVLFIGEGLHLQ